ncbi:S8 family serine peptidase [candidate division KSB3 bacterium]|uniref:S8 family serine peptidase n=1 Tax=candidate division KSB3 bacterium TaxID=2044937 RepID=A0A9D5JYU7_9BACT|nr:S8 family serine peptidase [candidate division KSB3 bacterium]MBD3326317.1 S8 family serine peptidase [candidate division KSB3 bacterium]
MLTFYDAHCPNCRSIIMNYFYRSLCCLLGVLAVAVSGHQTVAQAQPSYEEIIVNFVDAADQQDIESIAEEYDLSLVYNSIFSKEEVLLRFPVKERTADVLQTLMQALTAEEEIEYAEPNYLYQASFVPNDPLYPKQWNLRMIKTEDAWDHVDGKGAVVAVIDTGVAFEDYKDSKGTYHRASDLEITTFVKGYDFIDDDEHANDDNGHGTHVTGTVAQSTNNKKGVAGIAYNAAIMPLKVLNRYGFGNIADIAEAITYAADHGAHVINMSLGGGGESQLMREAIEYAYNKGVTIICAAGNEGRNRASYPAAYPYAIGVSSVGPTGNLAPYSNYGEGVDIAAPGGDTSRKREEGILQNTIGRMDPTKDSYEYFQGTSMASPHVAGVAALIVSAGVNDPAQVEEILFSTATPKNDPTKYGAGIVNAAAAVQAATQGAAGASSGKIGQVRLNITETLLYFLAGIGFSIFYFKLLKRSDGYGKLFSFLYFLAMFLSSSGLFVVAWLPRTAWLPPTVIHALSSPIPNLDRVFLEYPSAALHPLLHSALIPLILLVVLLHTKYGKLLAIGLAVGFASHLFVDAVFSPANVTYIPGSFLLDKSWLLIHSFLSFEVALLAGKHS